MLLPTCQEDTVFYPHATRHLSSILPLCISIKTNHFASPYPTVGQYCMNEQTVQHAVVNLLLGGPTLWG
jgi:hypothetical protein